MSSEGNSEIIPPTAVSGDGFVKYEGFWYSPEFLERVKRVQKNFKAQDSDVILCSFYKSGTTWLKALAFAIMIRGAKTKAINSDPTTNSEVVASSATTKYCNMTENPLSTLHPHECVRLLEEVPSTKPPKLDPSLFSSTKYPAGRRLLSSHIPYSSLPKSVTESGCKIVYICRDPKDVFVSLWHFAQATFPWFQGRTLDDVFEKFCRGEELYGPIWDHVLGFWNVAQERDEKVLFLKYEDLMSHTSYYVKKLAEFLDVPFTQEEEETGQVEKIIEFCSLEHLRNLDVNKNGIISTMGITVNHSSFFRKGQVGDWKNHLTPDMKERLDKIIRERFNGTGLNVIT